MQLRKRTHKRLCSRAHLRRLIGALGSTEASKILRLNKASIERYLCGDQEIAYDIARRIIDVEYMLSRALLVMQEDEIGTWLKTPEPLLGNRTPLKSMNAHGIETVIAVLDGIYAGVLV